MIALQAKQHESFFSSNVLLINTTSDEIRTKTFLKISSFFFLSLQFVLPAGAPSTQASAVKGGLFFYLISGGSSLFSHAPTQ